MNRKLRKGVLISIMLMTAVMMVFGAGCTKKKPAAQPAKPAVTEYKIGAILSVTGPAAFLGDPEKKTLEMLTEKVNAAGGINGAKINMIIEDDGGDEAKTKLAASKLIDKDGVLAIIGPSRSGNSMVIKDMMAEKQVSLLSCAAAEAIVDPVSPWVFKTPQKDSFVAEHLLKYMQDTKITKIAVIYDNTSFGQQGLKQIKDAASKFNVEVIFEESFQPAASDDDIVTLLTKIKANKKVQAIVNWTILPSQSVVPIKMKELKMDKIQLFCSHGFGNIKYVEKAGTAADGIIFPAGRLLVADELPNDHPQKAAMVEYKNEYEKKYGEAVSTFGGHAYDAFWIIVNAIRKAGGPDKGKIRDAIEGTTGFVGMSGIFNMTKEDHNGVDMTSLEMLTVKNGKFALLAAPAAAAPAAPAAAPAAPVKK